MGMKPPFLHFDSRQETLYIIIKLACSGFSKPEFYADALPGSCSHAQRPSKIRFVQTHDQDFSKLYLLMYADYIGTMSQSSDGLQKGLDILSDYRRKWKLKVNITKSQVLIFRTTGRLPRNLQFF